jgi:outer membrane protein
VSIFPVHAGRTGKGNFVKNGRKSMKKPLIRTLLGSLLAAIAALAMTSAMAYQAGDLIVRAGAAGVFPTGESEDIIVPFGVGATVEADDGWSLGITGTYMVSDNLGVGLLAAWPFEHDIDAQGTISAAGTVAEIKHLPPTLTLQYHFDTGSMLHPYVGAGINYTTFFSEDTKGVLSALNLDLDDSWGLALEVGADYELQNNWLVSAQLWYVDIDTEASLTGLPSFDVEIDPWVFMVGIGKKF